MPLQSARFNIVPYLPEYRSQLLEVWERSVLAMHHFLSQPDFEVIKHQVPEIDFSQLQVFCMLSGDEVCGFVGVADKKIEMLFLDPVYFGQGLGYRLLKFAVDELGADKLDVNEQNTGAGKFYNRCGFTVYERTDKDDQGRNYPLLRMKLG